MSRWDPFEDTNPFLGSLEKKAASTGFPLAGVVSFTSRCNLKCVHCYAEVPESMVGKELDTEEYKRIIDEIAGIGVLFLTITGGEPLARPDFKELYSYARNSGLMLLLFSNATLINDEVVALLRDLPPRYVDISLYGATEATYESITGIKGSYRRCIEGIELLLANDINVRLKSVLMKPNIKEFSELRELARGYGVTYRIDPMVFGRFNGDKSPLDLRISPELGVACEAEMEDFTDSIRTALNDPVRSSDKLYKCGAGHNTFYVSELGILRPCMMIMDIEADLRKYSFKEAWKKVGEKTFSLKAPADDECEGCELSAVCGYCPPMGKHAAYGDGEEKEYFCKIGRARSALI